MALLAALAVSSCGEPSVYLTPPWPSDQVAVILLEDTEGRPLSEPILYLGGPLRLSRPGPLVIRAFTYPREAELEACGVRLGGDGALLPPPSGSWLSGRVDEGTEPSFAPDPSAPHPDVRYDRCRSGDPCRTVPSPIAAPATLFGLSRVTFATSELAFFGGFSRSVTDERAVFGRLLAEHAELLPPRDELMSEVRGLERDPSGQVWALTRAALVAIGPDGAPTFVVAWPEGPVELSTGTSGGAFVVSSDGRVRRYDASHGAIDELVGLPAGVVKFLDAGPTRRFATLDDGSIFGFDGQTWRRESEGRDVRYLALAGDDDVVVAVPRIGDVFAKSGSPPTWHNIGRPFESFPRAAVGLGGGRAVVVGEGGSAAMWSGYRWCRLETGTTRVLTHAAISPDRSRLLIVGDTPGTLGAPVFLAYAL